MSGKNAAEYLDWACNLETQGRSANLCAQALKKALIADKAEHADDPATASLPRK